MEAIGEMLGKFNCQIWLFRVEESKNLTYWSEEGSKLQMNEIHGQFNQEAF